MIRVEWIRQTRRIRTWACLAGLAAVPIIFSIAAYVDPPRERRELNVFTLLTASGAFAQRWIDKAQGGWYFQNNAGAWTRK